MRREDKGKKGGLRKSEERGYGEERRVTEKGGKGIRRIERI